MMKGESFAFNKNRIFLCSLVINAKAPEYSNRMSRTEAAYILEIIRFLLGLQIEKHI